MEIGLSEVTKFCTRKLIKRTHFMSQDMMPNFSPKNVGLEVSRPAIFMINRTQLKPKNQVLYVRKTWCESLHFLWRVESHTKFSKKKKKMGEGRLHMNTIFRRGLLGKIGVRFFRMEVGVQFLHKDKLKSEIFNENKSLLTKMFSSVNLNSEFSYF